MERVKTQNKGPSNKTVGLCISRNFYKHCLSCIFGAVKNQTDKPMILENIPSNPPEVNNVEELLFAAIVIIGILLVLLVVYLLSFIAKHTNPPAQKWTNRFHDNFY